MAAERWPWGGLGGLDGLCLLDGALTGAGTTLSRSVAYVVFGGASACTTEPPCQLLEFRPFTLT